MQGGMTDRHMLTLLRDVSMAPNAVHEMGYCLRDQFVGWVQQRRTHHANGGFRYATPTH